MQVRANGVTLEADAIGPEDGPAVLLIMGYASQMTGWPETFREGLAAAGFRVIRFDNRDAGLSQKWDGVLPDFKAVAADVRAGRTPAIPYTLDDLADDAAGVLDAFAVQSAHVLGASMGGMIAQLMALNHPARVRALISVMSTTSDPDLPRSDPEVQAALMTPPPASDRDSVVAHGLKTRAALTGRGLAADPAWLRPVLEANYERSFYPEGALRQWAAILAAPPRGDALKRLSVPALVLHGSDDRLILPEAGRRTAACIPGARHVEIAGWGHDMNPAAVPPVLDALVPFLRETEAARAARSGV